jgi:hypothetical protein
LYETIISIKEEMLQPLSDIYLKDIGEKRGKHMAMYFVDVLWL